MLYALLGVIAVFVVLAFIISRVEGLEFFAPKSTKRIGGPAYEFCTQRCRTEEGRCPLTGTEEAAVHCPLWRFVEADLPTALYGNPFAQLRTS